MKRSEKDIRNLTLNMSSSEKAEPTIEEKDILLKSVPEETGECDDSSSLFENGEKNKKNSLSEDEVKQVRNFLAYLNQADNETNNDEIEFDEPKYKKPTIFSRINKTVLFACIFIITLICLICFHNLFFKILILIEAVAACIFAIYSTIEKDVILIDTLSDGLKYIEPQKNGRKLNDLVLQEPVEELRDLVDYVKNPEEFKELGYAPEKKVLIVGETGYGKNALIEAFANETNLPIIKVNGARFFDSDDVVDKMFQLAEKNSGMSYIIFIELFEKLLENASDSSDSSETILDKINTYLAIHPNIIFFTTCEDVCSVMNDNAIYESMFKKVIVIKEPVIGERIKLLKEFTSEINLDANVDLEHFAKNCYGFSVGDLKYLVAKAASISRKNKHSTVQIDDLLEAFDILAFGKSDKRVSKESREIVAYHESGHALVHYLRKGSKNLLRVISISRGDAGGLTFFDPNFENIIHSEEDLMNEVCISYGGRCAEKIVFGKYSTGASGDIQHATSIICNMIQSYGMSDSIGALNVSPMLSSVSNISNSPEITNLVAKECIRISKKCEEDTLKLLEENRDKLDKLAKYLIEHESITGEELDELLKNISTKQE